MWNYLFLVYVLCLKLKGEDPGYAARLVLARVCLGLLYPFLDYFFNSLFVISDWHNVLDVIHSHVIPVYRHVTIG